MEKALSLSIKDDIKEIKKQNIEQLLSTLRYSLVAYLKAYFTYGANHKVTNEARNIWYEFKDIIKNENDILNYIKKNVSNMDFEAVDDLLAKLDELNEDTVMYYFDLIDSVEDACDTKQEWRITRPRRNFKTLIETDEYYLKTISLTLSLKDIESFLNMPKEFFDFTESKSISVNPYIEEDGEYFYGVYPKVENNILVDYRVILPEVVDDNSAAINVNLYSKAYELYKLLGSTYSLDEQVVEDKALELEKQFNKTIKENKR